jgi:hypothetical protein
MRAAMVDVGVDIDVDLWAMSLVTEAGVGVRV